MPAEDATVTCPDCGSEFDIADRLRAHIEAEVRVEIGTSIRAEMEEKLESRVSEERKVMLVVLLSPVNCIPTAMSIQSHAPDKLLIINPRPDHRPDPMKGTPHQDRLEGWLSGPQGLASKLFEDDSLEDPFPIPHTLPNGYMGDLSEGCIEWAWCKSSEILDLLKESSATWEGEVRFDILPGVKGVKIPLILDGLDGEFSIWETQQDGEKIEYYRGMKNVAFEAGLPLSIIDRCWLSGYPVHAEAHRQGHMDEGMTTEEVSFMRGVAECFVIDYPHKWKSVFTLEIGRNERSLKKLEERGYDYQILNRSKARHSPGLSIRISKGGIEREFSNVSRTKKQQKFWHGKDGVWLEEFVEASLWAGWNPSSTIRGLSIISDKANRKMQFGVYWGRRRSLWENASGRGGILEVEGKRWADTCERHGLETSESVKKLVECEFSRLQAASEEERVEALSHIRSAELDVVLLDSMGVTAFDSKAVMNEDWFTDGSPVESHYFSSETEVDWGPSGKRQGKRSAEKEARRKILGQSPDWLVRNSFFTIHSANSTHQSPILPKRIHMQRMWEGRDALLSDGFSSPTDIPEGRVFLGEWMSCLGCGEKLFLEGKRQFEFHNETAPDGSRWDPKGREWYRRCDVCAIGEEGPEKEPAQDGSHRMPSEMVGDVWRAILPYLPCKWIIVEARIRNFVPEGDRVRFFGTKEAPIEDWGPLLGKRVELYQDGGVWWVKKADADSGAGRHCNYCGSTDHNRAQCEKLANDRASGTEYAQISRREIENAAITA